MRNTRKKSDAVLWSIPLRIEDIPEGGAHFARSADADVRHAIAASAGLVALPRLDAAFEVRRHGRGGAHVTGTVSAEIEQTCVVTLEPLHNVVDEGIDLTLAPAVEAAEAHSDALSEATANAADPPDPLVDDTLDLGSIAVEFLLLGIDPYPRKADAAFASPQTDAGRDQGAHPFAALAALKKNEPKLD